MSGPIPFEQALMEIERILRELEDGTTTLEDALARYERGVGLIRHCYSQLQNAEQRIQQLTGLSAEGKADLQPFEHTAALEKSNSPIRRKPPKASPAPDGLF